MKKQISERAIEERVRRKLLTEGVMLRKDKDGFFGVNQQNAIEFSGTGLSALATEMNILKAWEVMS